MMKEKSSKIRTHEIEYYFDAERQFEWEQTNLNYKVFRFHKLHHKVHKIPEKNFESTITAIESLLDAALAQKTNTEPPEAIREKKALSKKLYQSISEQVASSSQDKGATAAIGTINSTL